MSASPLGNPNSLGSRPIFFLCIQEVNGQEEPGQPRCTLALKKLLENTPYNDYNQAITTPVDPEQVYDERKLVILSRFNIIRVAVENRLPLGGGC